MGDEDMIDSLPRTCVILLGSLVMAPFAHADGGLVRFSEPCGKYHVTVFTQPTPFRVGPVDVSVLVQEAATGRTVDADVTVRLRRQGQTEAEVVCSATEAAATNKLLRAAVFDLPAPGMWEVQIEVAGAFGSVDCGFALSAEEPLPAWRTHWPWFVWPVVPVLLFLSRLRRGR